MDGRKFNNVRKVQRLVKTTELYGCTMIFVSNEKGRKKIVDFFKKGRLFCILSNLVVL